MTYSQWLDDAARLLAGGESPRRDAQILLEFVTGRGRAWLLAFGETPLASSELEQLDMLLKRRADGQPIAYLLGEREFWSMMLKVSPATLIPRPDTECLVEQALALLPAGAAEVLDLGTGTGAIALALARERPAWRVTGVDVQPEAVELARGNALRHGVNNVRFETGSWFKSLQGKRYSLIVSNPPYIDVDDPHLGQGDVRFEPQSALVAGDGGLADLAAIISGAAAHLFSGGWLVLEHGWRQGEAVRGLLARARFSKIATCNDYGGNERVSMAQWPG